MPAITTGGLTVDEANFEILLRKLFIFGTKNFPKMWVQCHRMFQVDIPTRQLVTNVRCGPDATVLLTNSGSIIAVGSNLCNKLKLNHREGFFSNMKASTVRISFSFISDLLKSLMFL